MKSTASPLRRIALLGLVFVAASLSCTNEPQPVAPSGVPIPPAAPPPASGSAPDSIVDLAAVHPQAVTESGFITLHWTVPEDNDEPGAPPVVYEVHYSDTSHDGDAWLATPYVVRRSLVRRPGEIQTLIVGPFPLAEHHFFAIRAADAADHWSAWSNVARSNRPPDARFTVSGDPQCPGETVHVDARASTDADDDDGSLLVRWDWENDGVWDTPFQSEKEADHTYANPARYTIGMEVRDPGGGTTGALYRFDFLRILSVRRSAYWEQYEGYCCRWGGGGGMGPSYCLQWCSHPAWASFDGLGAWNVLRRTWVSPDSIFIGGASQTESDYGFSATIALCAPVRFHMTGIGGIAVAIRQSQVLVFEHDGPEDEPRFEFSGELAPGTYSIVMCTRYYYESQANICMVFAPTGDSP